MCVGAPQCSSRAGQIGSSSIFFCKTKDADEMCGYN